MKPKGLLTETDYFELAQSLETAWELDTFLDACEAEYLPHNPRFYGNLLFGLFRLRSTYLSAQNQLLKEHPNDDYLKANNKPGAKIARLDRVREYLLLRRDKVAEGMERESGPPIRTVLDKHLPNFPLVDDPGVRNFIGVIHQFERLSESGIVDHIAKLERTFEQNKEQFAASINAYWMGDYYEPINRPEEVQEQYSQFFLAVIHELANAARGIIEQEPTFTAQEWALYYFYLAETGNYPQLRESPGKAYEEITANLPGIKASTFGTKYRKIKTKTDRLNGPNNAERIKRILPLLREYPEALQQAESELTEMQSDDKKK